MDRAKSKEKDVCRNDAVRPPRLAALDQVVLSDSRQRLYEEALKDCSGSVAWRKRKEAEARDLVALSEITSRFDVGFLDLRESLRAVAVLHAPVPLSPDGQGKLRIAPLALLGITYPEEAIRRPLPGHGSVQLLQPVGIFHPNALGQNPQLLCLGPALPVSIQLKEIVLMSYALLTLQTVMLDEVDPAGVMNGEAARYFQERMHLVPLTREPFLDPV
jgi:hypothetical protein